MLGKLLWRGVRLRCPRCGVGKLYRRGYAMYESCGACGWVFEREEGYWTGAIAVNLVVTELLIFGVIFPLLIFRASLGLTIALGVSLAILTPLLFYWHSKSLWMTLDFYLHPTELVSAGHIMTVDELRRLIANSPDSDPADTPPAPQHGDRHEGKHDRPRVSDAPSGPSQPLDMDEQEGDVGGGHAGDA